MQHMILFPHINQAKLSSYQALHASLTQPIISCNLSATVISNLTQVEPEV